MTRKKPDKNEKTINQTANQSPMANPEAQEVISYLRDHWNKLSPLQRGEKLNVLIGLQCTRRGIGRALGVPESTIRRDIKVAKPHDWFAEMQDAWAEEPQDQSETNADEDVRQITSEVPSETRVGPIIKEVHLSQDHSRTSTAQQTRKIPSLLKIPSPLSTKVKQPPVVNVAKNGQENRAGEDIPKSSQADAWMRRQQIIDDKIQRLAALSEQDLTRPPRDATSMKKQGKKWPPEDPQ